MCRASVFRTHGIDSVTGKMKPGMENKAFIRLAGNYSNFDRACVDLLCPSLSFLSLAGGLGFFIYSLGQEGKIIFKK